MQEIFRQKQRWNNKMVTCIICVAIVAVAAWSSSNHQMVLRSIIYYVSYILFVVIHNLLYLSLG